MKKRSLVGWLMVLLLCPSLSVLGIDAKYLEEVVGRQAVTVGDGYELIMYLLDLEGKYGDAEAQIVFLRENQIAKPSTLEKPPNGLLRRGELAYMLVKALKFRGGLKAAILGMNERFAMEELIYRGIMRKGHGKDLVTGQELVLVMTRAAEHLAQRR